MAHLLVKHPKKSEATIAGEWRLDSASLGGFGWFHQEFFHGTAESQRTTRFVSCQLLGDTQVCMGPFEWVLSPLEISWIGGKLWCVFFGVETGANLANFNQVTSDF